jgi:single-stranded-DNA-specific exonuclease
MTDCRWLLPTSIPAAELELFAAALGGSPVVAELLWRRGVREVEAARQFLDPRLRTLGDPFALPDMEAAVTRILAAVDGSERIAIYGDYDVDGVTALALLTRVLRALGAEAARFLPHRVDEGYGLSADGVARCVEEHRPQLLIAVDCGTTSVAEIARLAAAGVEVIVIDHHECAAELPQCVALVNPKRGDAHRYLCSVGLVFKVAHALLKRRPVAGFDLRDVLDLVALGSVADLVPLVEENRVLVKRGLARLADSRWPGVRALLEVSGLIAPLGPADIGFGLGPRLNAAGRLGTAQDALELLLTEDPLRAREIAEGLEKQNRERRAVEDQVAAAAEQQLAEWFDPAQHAAIVVGAPGWHVGVVGIVASRVQRKHYRPVFVIGFDENGLGKGSGRSIEGLSLIAALKRCAPHLEKYGGHEMAAGVTVRAAKFTLFRESFLSAARDLLNVEQLRPCLRLDAELPLDRLDHALLAGLDALQPYGVGHHAPIFFARKVSLAAEPRVMKEKHYGFLFSQRGTKVRGVWFGGVQHELPPPPWDVAFTVERNEYQGVVSAQMHVKALRTSVVTQP